MRAKEALYVSVFDDAVVCRSACLFDVDTRTAFAISPADGDEAELANEADALTDEFVLVDGVELRAPDVRFDY